MSYEKWSGEGIPPVGTFCDGYVQNSGREWKWLEVEILKHNDTSNNECAVHVTKHGILRWCDQFRPIRTPEQIAAEERLHAIDEMIDFVVPCITYRNLISALYDAGYRKTEVNK